MTKQDYLGDLEGRIAAAKTTLAELEAQRAELSAKQQHAAIDQLEASITSTEHQIEDLKRAGEGAWQDIRQTIEALWDELDEWVRDHLQRKQNRQ
jgi:predicted  nucleic acid-binding Zn-ribbon protein